MTSYVPVIKNGAAGAIFYVGLVSQANTKILQANPTLAAGDVKVSIDGGATANLGTLPTVTPAAGKQVKVTLSQAEVNGDNITVTFSDAAGAEWCDLIVNIQTAARQIDDLATPTNITGGTITTVTTLTNLPAITANWLTAAGTAADFTTEIQTGLATQASVDAVDDLLDTELAAVKTVVDAVKVQTDKLTFTVANVLDANTLRVNGVALAAANLAKTTSVIGRCTVGAASSTTSIVTSACVPTGVDADQFKGRIITFDADTTTTGLRGQSTDITANTAAAAPVFTATALTQAPVSGDTFSIT